MLKARIKKSVSHKKWVVYHVQLAGSSGCVCFIEQTWLPLFSIGTCHSVIRRSDTNTVLYCCRPPSPRPVSQIFARPAVLVVRHLWSLSMNQQRELIMHRPRRETDRDRNIFSGGRGIGVILLTRPPRQRSWNWSHNWHKIVPTHAEGSIKPPVLLWEEQATCGYNKIPPPSARPKTLQEGSI